MHVVKGILRDDGRDKSGIIVLREEWTSSSGRILIHHQQMVNGNIQYRGKVMANHFYYIRKVREIRDMYEVYGTAQSKDVKYVLKDGVRVSQIPAELTKNEILEEFRAMTDMEVLLFQEKGFD